MNTVDAQPIPIRLRVEQCTKTRANSQPRWAGGFSRASRMTHDWWYPPDPDGARHCTHVGCTVRVKRAYSLWQAAKRQPWQWTHKELIPDCTGKKRATSAAGAR
jgi:hypothetical protein